MSESFIPYLLDGKTGKRGRAFSVSSDKENLITKYNEARATDAVDESGFKNISDRNIVPIDGFVGLLDRSLQLGLSQSHLITIANTARPISRNFASKFQVFDPVAKQASLIDKNDDYSIYGLTESIYADFLVRMRRLDSLDEALRDLPGTVLMGLVATFDAFVADSVREMLKKYPERYTSSEKEVKVKEVLLHGSFDDFISSMIDDDVYHFTRGSHEEQIKFIEKNFDIPIAAYWKSYAKYIEIFERRNLIAHGERSSNQRYTRICIAAGYKSAENTIDQPVKLTIKYLQQSADTLVEFAVILILTLWRKHEKETETLAFSKINEIIFELIQSGRYLPAVSIATSALDIKKSACNQITRCMLTVNLASAHKHLKQEAPAMNALNSIDWSASADNFKICVASLREDHSEISLLMPLVAAAKSIDADAFRTWPVFSFVRKSSEFEELFHSVFGEPLVRVKENSAETVQNVESVQTDSIH